MERRPDPPPLETNDVAIVGGGTAVWALAAAVLLVLRALDKDIHSWWVWMCVTGTVLGLLGVRTCARRRSRLTPAET